MDGLCDRHLVIYIYMVIALEFYMYVLIIMLMYIYVYMFSKYMCLKWKCLNVYFLYFYLVLIPYL